MTLEQGISEYEKSVEYYKRKNYPQSTIDDALQMIEWLKELKRYRESDEVTK